MLDSDFALDAAGMGFGPDERGVDDADLGQTTQFAQAESEKFARLGLCYDPLLGRREPAIAVTALVEGSFTLDACRDVDGELDTIVTESASGNGAVNRCATVAAEDTIQLVSTDRTCNAELPTSTHVAAVCSRAWLGAIDTESRSIDMMTEDVLCVGTD